MIFGRYFILLILATTFAVAVVAQQARAIHLGYRVERLHAEEVGRLDVGLLDPVALTQAFASERPDGPPRGQRASAR